MDAEALAQKVRAGDARAVACAISWVEDGAGALPALSAALYPETGRAYTIGLTGAPGVGKSSLTARVIETARGRDITVAVLAIDPTSPFTGGALLGDRLRMQTHATDPGVFIRSMATRGHLGGLALATPEAIRILDASGRDLIVVETVGVGQVEVEVAKATDTTLVVVNPGWGDSVQAAKAGILEVADVFVVNKADREGADAAVRDLEVMLGMGPKRGWTPPVVPTSALEGNGIEELWAAAESHREYLSASGDLERRRSARLLAEVEEMASQRLKRSAADVARELHGLAEDLAARRVDPYEAAALLEARLTGR